MSRGALVGTRVLDATRALSGPLCTMVLGDLGADVIKLEMPGDGDETRHWGPPFVGDAGPTLLCYNRNKRSVAANLHTQEGRDLCLALAGKCDVFVENFRPGTMRRFGLDYAAMKVVRPDIVYCSISGYGQTGPMALRPSFDLMVQAVSGLMAQTGEPKGRPVKAAAPVSDVMGGLCAVVAVMSALMERAQTGEGRFLDISMLDGTLVLLGQAFTAWGMTGQGPKRWGNGHPLMTPYESFRTADREIVFGITNEKTWTSFSSIPEFRALAADSRFATQSLRNDNRAAIVPAVEAVLSTRPADYWLKTFDELGIPAEPINELPEILASQQITGRGMVLEVEYPAGSGQRIGTPGMPWRDVAADRPVMSPPSLGQHTEEVLRELGLR